MSATYGSTQSSRARNGVLGPRDDEGQPLLNKPDSRGLVGRSKKVLNEEVNRNWADVVLLICYVTTGLLDSSSTNAWGAFVSMQTGNTVYVGLGLASLVHPPVTVRLWRSGISLISFCLGSFFFARFHRFFSPKRRWVMVASYAAQMMFTVAAAIIVTVSGPAESDTVDWTVLVPLALVAFQSCGQAVTSRALKYNALTSVVLTSIYCDLFSDQDLFALKNVERNRRAAAPLLLLLGAFIGGLLAHSSFGIAGALWLAAVMKLAVVITWLLWPAEPSDDDE